MFIAPRGGDHARGSPFPMTTSTPRTQTRVLLIDDDELIAGSLHRYLLTRGFAVDVALEPVSAATMMASSDYGVIVVDPYLTGEVMNATAALIETVRTLQPLATLIILTGYSSPALQIAATAHGAAAVLSKPQSVTCLGDLIHNIPLHDSSERSL
jgi:two-component system, cell cycle sensor histidine kinase and response regulator CckA